MTSDQFWSFFAMPIGVLLCFGPIVIAWLTSGAGKPPRDDVKNRR